MCIVDDYYRENPQADPPKLTTTKNMNDNYPDQPQFVGHDQSIRHHPFPEHLDPRYYDEKGYLRKDVKLPDPIPWNSMPAPSRPVLTLAEFTKLYLGLRYGMNGSGVLATQIVERIWEADRFYTTYLNELKENTL